MKIIMSVEMMLMMKLYEKLFYNGEKISKIVMVLILLTVIMIIRNIYIIVYYSLYLLQYYSDEKH